LFLLSQNRIISKFASISKFLILDNNNRIH